MHIPLHIWVSLDQSQKPEALEIELIDEIIQTAIPLMSHNHLLGGRNTLEAGGSGEVWSRKEVSQWMAKVGITQYLLSPFQSKLVQPLLIVRHQYGTFSQRVKDCERLLPS